MAAELVREQMFRYLHQEVPYALQVRKVIRFQALAHSGGGK